MTVAGFLFALMIAVLLTAIFSLGFRTRGPWGSWWTFFLVLFLAVWASEVWVQPTGPMFLGIAWLPLIFVGILFALILAAATPRNNAGTSGGSESTITRERATAITIFSAVFWIILLILVVAIITGAAVHNV